MDNKGKKWSLYNQKTDKQVDGLKLTQVRAIVESLAPKELVTWKAWREGLSEWLAIDKFPELKKGYVESSESEESDIIRNIKVSQETKKANQIKTGTNTATASVVSSVSSTSSRSSKRDSTPRKVFDLDDEIEKSRIILMSSEKSDGRNTTRYKVSFEVSVRFSALTLNCKTIDMSLGGMWIDQQLPGEADAAMVNCVIERAGARLEFACCVIPDPKLKGSTRLIIKKINKPDLLRSWLLENS